MIRYVDNMSTRFTRRAAMQAIGASAIPLAEKLVRGFGVRASRSNREKFPMGVPLHMLQFRFASESPDAM